MWSFDSIEGSRSHCYYLLLFVIEGSSNALKAGTVASLDRFGEIALVNVGWKIGNMENSAQCQALFRLRGMISLVYLCPKGVRWLSLPLLYLSVHRILHHCGQISKICRQTCPSYLNSYTIQGSTATAQASSEMPEYGSHILLGLDSLHPFRLHLLHFLHPRLCSGRKQLRSNGNLSPSHVALSV